MVQAARPDELNPVQYALWFARVNQSQLARALEIRPQTVQRWAKDGEFPLDRLPQIHAALDGRVSFTRLAPRYFSALMQREPGLFTDADGDRLFAADGPKDSAAHA